MSFLCEAVIFDLDGTLVDSNEISDRHLRLWTTRRGLPYERFAAIHRGRTTEETIRLAAPELDAVAEALELETAEADDKDGLIAIAGASRLLSALPDGRWAIATSGKRRTATTRLSHVGLPVPAVLVTADDVSRGKPSPEPYLLAAARLGIQPDRCVVVEDAPAGVASARAAGARVVGISSPTVPAATLAAADVVLGRLDDLRIDVGVPGLRIGWPTPA